MIFNSYYFLKKTHTKKANVAQFRLVIRDVTTLQIVNLFTCLDTIQYIEVRVGGIQKLSKKKQNDTFFILYSGHQIQNLFYVLYTNVILFK